MPTKANATQRSAAAALLGRKGGAANTDAQQRARRTNAQRAGRPRRVCVLCDQPVIGGHVDRALDDTCGAHGWRWQQRSATTPPAAERPIVIVRGHATVLLRCLAAIEEPDAEVQAALRQLRKALRG